MLLIHKDLYKPNLRWWEWPLAILFCVIVEPLVLLLVVLMVLIPIPTYIRAAFLLSIQTLILLQIPVLFLRQNNGVLENTKTAFALTVICLLRLIFMM